MKIYIETSAILYLISDSDPYKKDRTIEMYEQISTMNISSVISEIVNIELKKAPPALEKCIHAIIDKKKIREIALRVEHTELTKAIVGQGILPSSNFLEAIHIATATIEKSDFLVSWDFEYIFNILTIQKLREFAKTQNINIPSIVNPEALIKMGFGNPRTLQDLRNFRSHFSDLGLEKIIDIIRYSN